MLKISKEAINNLREIMSRSCDYAETQEFVNDLVTETSRELGSKYPYGDDIGLIEDIDSGEFSTVSEFANIFWDKVVISFLNILETEEENDY